MLTRTGTRSLVIGLAAIAAATVAGPASALAEEKIIEETIVRARKRTENVTEVPVAVTLLGSDAIKKQLITRIEDLGRVASTHYGSRAQPDDLVCKTRKPARGFRVCFFPTH